MRKIGFERSLTIFTDVLHSCIIMERLNDALKGQDKMLKGRNLFVRGDKYVKSMLHSKNQFVANAKYFKNNEAVSMNSKTGNILLHELI